MRTAYCVRDRWGLLPALVEVGAIALSAINMRAYHSGQILSRTELGPEQRHITIHRAGYQKVLARKAAALGVQMRFGSAVYRVDCITPAVGVKSVAVPTKTRNLNVRTRTGAMDTPEANALKSSTFVADLIVGADGINAISRSFFLRTPSPPRQGGNAAYRLAIDALRNRDALHDLLKPPELNQWIGPGKHVVGYPMGRQAVQCGFRRPR